MGTMRKTSSQYAKLYHAIPHWYPVNGNTIIELLVLTTDFVSEP